MRTHTPALTYALLVVNIFIFLADALLNGQLTQLGAKDNAALLAGEYWRLVTPMFLHGGILHIGFNSYFLYIIGPQVERAFGSFRFAALYFLSGISGVIFSFAFNRAPSIGASGALFGLIGALIPFLYRNRALLVDTRRRILSILQVIGINLLIGLAPGIDNWGHLGGLLAGLGLAWVTTPLYQVRPGAEDTIIVEDKSTPAVSWLAFLGGSVVLLGLFQFAMILRR